MTQRGVPFTKMSGAGNDFVVLGSEAAREVGPELAAWIRRVCRRGVSVGADGVLIVERSAEARVLVRFFNPDGGEAFCGNGSRCAARYAHLRGFAPASMILETRIGDVPARVDGDGVRLSLRLPDDRGPRRVEEDDLRLAGRLVIAGVPHFVVFVEDLARAPLSAWGPRVRHHAQFAPDGTNLDLIAWRTDGSLALRTWERGVEGETLACGSGAIAAAAVAGDPERDATVRVVPASGVPLVVRFERRTGRTGVILEGDARVIFEATLDAEAISGFPLC